MTDTDGIINVFIASEKIFLIFRSCIKPMMMSNNGKFSNDKVTKVTELVSKQR